MPGKGRLPEDSAGPGRSEPAFFEDLVALAAGLIGADTCEFLVETDDRLVVRASSRDPPDGGASYPRWTGILGNAYTSGLACVVDDCLDTRGAATVEPGGASPATQPRSLCCVPVADHGLLVGKAVQPAAFDDADRERLERLAEVAGEALDGADPPPEPMVDGGTRNDRPASDPLEEIGDILSHDLTNPLNVARGNLELARERGEDQFFDQVDAALDRIEGLIDETVVLARTGEHVDETAQVDLAHRARTAWEQVQTADATLELEGTLTFSADERGVTHLLENLLENAVTHAGESVTVRLGPLEDGFYLEDDGPGIPPEHRDRVFERGYSPEAGTTGLGLHIVRRLADAHGWDLDVGTAAAGGTRFEITGVEAHEE